MDLKSGYPYWAIKNGLIAAFPRLEKPIRVEALIVGGGITGALVATRLKRAGLSVAVVDRREIGWGSTAASTALVQYEIDTELHALAELYGDAAAAEVYLACERAVREVLALARSLRGVEAFKQKSLYLASHFWHVKRLRREHAQRRAAGLRVDLLERDELRERLALDAPMALLSHTAGVIDPYALTYALLGRLRRAGAAIHDRTEMIGHERVRGGVQATFDSGARVHCKHLVLACGYEAQRMLDEGVAKNRSSYAFVTDTQPDELGMLRQHMVWESARPYLYMRRTGDGRMLVGGEDDSIDVPARRDAAVAAKAAKLAKRAHALFPQIDWRPAFAWGGTFAETPDGLPYFGPHAQHGPRVHFAMAYGGNGITFSWLGAEILAASLTGKKHPLARRFSFERLR